MDVSDLNQVGSIYPSCPFPDYSSLSLSFVVPVFRVCFLWSWILSLDINRLVGLTVDLWLDLSSFFLFLFEGWEIYINRFNFLLRKNSGLHNLHRDDEWIKLASIFYFFNYEREREKVKIVLRINKEKIIDILPINCIIDYIHFIVHG